MIQKQVVSNQPRVLIIENDRRWRHVHERNLTYWGYRTFTAQGQGLSLLQDAIQKVSFFRCHVAIVDMRLVDHDSRSDRSGLNLLPKLKPTQSIIVSGYPDFMTARSALTEKGATGFVGKEEGPEIIKKVLKEALRTICAATKQIKIEWPPGLSAEAIIARLFPDAPDPIPTDQVEDLLVRLFPQAKRLQLQMIDGLNDLPQSGPRLHSIVLKVYIDDFVQPEIIKIASPKDIKTQDERYRTYVEGRLFGTFHSILKKQVILWDIGAARYDFLGAPNQEMKTWAKLYGEAESVEELVKPLVFFFDELWSHYYRRANQTCCDSLFTSYCAVWGVTWRKRLQRSFKHSYLKINVLKREIVNPVRWLFDKIDHQADNKIKIPETRLAITHGDLHGGNLFVHEARAWVIDFERTGLGPIYQDFAELEVNTLIELAKFESSASFYQSITILLEATRADEIEPALLTDQDAHKALRIIKEIRQLAEKKITEFEMEVYMWCMLFDTLFIVSLQTANSQEREVQRDRALLLGGLICEKLDKKLELADEI